MQNSKLSLRGVKRRSNLTKRDCFATLAMTGKGFTLVEIIIVLSLVSIISTISLGGFVSYSRAQKLSAAQLEVATALQTARSRAMSQVKTGIGGGSCSPSSNYLLDGYQVVISTNTYLVSPQCGTFPDSSTAQLKYLPQNITFASGYPAPFLFSLNGTISSAISLTITIVSSEITSNNTKTITIDPSGRITAN